MTFNAAAAVLAPHIPIFPAGPQQANAGPAGQGGAQNQPPALGVNLPPMIGPSQANMAAALAGIAQQQPNAANLIACP